MIARTVALASLSIIAVAGCGTAQETTGVECVDARSGADGLVEEINALRDELEAGTAADAGELESKERAWAVLVLSDSECFSAEQVAVARTVLQALSG
jgi:hypothetical protein